MEAVASQLRRPAANISSDFARVPTKPLASSGIGEVVGIVTKRLVEINRHAQAAELYEGIDAHREAINVYIAGGLWDQAKQLARSAAPQFAAEVEAAHKAHMQQSGAAADLVHTGNVAEGIEAYAQQNEWDRARELAQQQGPAMLLKSESVKRTHDDVQIAFVPCMGQFIVIPHNGLPLLRVRCQNSGCNPVVIFMLACLRGRLRGRQGARRVAGMAWPVRRWEKPISRDS